MAQADLSIVILTYNAKEITTDAIASIEKNYPDEVADGRFEIIIPDNASSDGTPEAMRAYHKKSTIKTMHVIDNGGNIGFSAGNNKGVPYIKGKYVLFLNSDTIVYPKTLTYMLDFMKAHPDVGAASCKLINKDGELDFNCHRGFPSPWNSFCYFTGLQRLFPHSKTFAGYTQGWKDLKTNHEVDAIEGAFMIMPYEVGEKVGWWDEDYFFYGEDLQFSYNIKKLGYKIYYIGEVSIMHIGGASSGIKKKTQNLTKANVETKRMLQKARFEAMRIFYKKNYEKSYPAIVKWIMFAGINYMEKKTLAGLTVTNQ